MIKYEKYKDSGIEWIGEIPEHWEVKKLSYCFENIGSGTTPTSGKPEYYFNGEFNWLQTGDLNDNEILNTSKQITQKALNDYSTLRFYPIDSIVIAMYGATIGKTGIIKIESTTNQACCVLAKPIDSDAKYIFYWFSSVKTHIISMSYGGGQPNINQEMIRFLRIQLPPLAEQTAIANYLDRKTAEIDNLVAKKERLLKLYEEEKTAIINQAVTKGIPPLKGDKGGCPDVKLKDSGIEWLGNIPEHWEVKRLKLVTSTITNGYVGPTRNILKQEGIQYIQSLHIKDNTIKFDYPYYVEQEWSDNHSRSILNEKDILVVQTGAGTGNIGIVPKEFEGSNCHALIIIRINPEKSLPDYIMNVLTSNYGKDTLKSIETGALHPHLNSTKICDIDIPLPNTDEQTAIVAHIEKETARIKAKVAKTKKLINFLKEYRTALISEAVTGKIKVIEEESL